MDSVDAHMTNGPDCSVVSGQNIDTLKQILEQSLRDINATLAKGVHEIKAELSDQVQTILISIPRQPAQSNNPINSLMGSFRSGAGHVMSEVLGGGDPDHWKAQCELLEQEKETLRVDQEKLRLEKDQRYRALEVRMGNMTQISANTEELQQRLAATNQQNSELREQVSKFREIILKKTNNQVQATPDSTLMISFGDLRVRIQHIVFKFYRFDKTHLKLKGASSRQHDFFGLWARGYTDAQLKRRARAKIFEILSEGILCRPIFGLDDFDKTGDLESSLSTFESSLNSLTRGHGEISEWRAQTVKCAQLLECPKSKRPGRIMTEIMDFMEPISPEKKTEKYIHLREALLDLCTSAFKLSLQLRECKDLYKCEIPSPGSPFIEDEADEQDSESSSAAALPATRIAFAMSGALVKYPENQAGSRIVLEKAHVVTCV